MNFKTGQVFVNKMDLYDFGGWLAYKKGEKRIVFADVSKEGTGFLYSEPDPINYGIFTMDLKEVERKYELEDDKK